MGSLPHTGTSGRGGLHLVGPREVDQGTSTGGHPPTAPAQEATPGRMASSHSSSSAAAAAAIATTGALPSAQRRRILILGLSLVVVLGIQLHFSLSSQSLVTATYYGGSDGAATAHLLQATSEDPTPPTSERQQQVVGSGPENRTHPTSQNHTLPKAPSIELVPLKNAADGNAARLAHQKVNASSEASKPTLRVPPSSPVVHDSTATAVPPHNHSVSFHRRHHHRLPTCLCPTTCDLSGPHGRPCLEAIATLRFGNGSNPSQQHRDDMGEIRACREAVYRGGCGMDCLPGHCAVGNDHPAAGAAAVLNGINTSSAPHDGDYVDWSIVEDWDLPRPGTFQRRQEGVVIATKVMGPEMIGQTKQMLCLLTAAYNRHVNYDIVIFSTLPWEADLIQELRAVVPYTKLIVASEGPTLEDQLSAMTRDEVDYLRRRCNAMEGENLTWYHRCSEVPNTTRFEVRLSYAWQAEFRAQRVWNMPELEPYKYMMWVDTDALCSKPWIDDPVKLMVEHDLVLLFDNLPGDYATNVELKDKLHRAYNRTICKVNLSDGTLKAHPCKDNSFSIALVHGFFHVSNLDFFRSSSASRFLRILVESQRFSREWDDQLAVTIPPAMEAPDKAWDLRFHGWNLSIFHNGHIDGKGRESPVRDSSYRTYWNETVRHQWALANRMCHPLVKFTG